MTSKCNRLSELLRVQAYVIQRNLPVHKWLKHIPDEEHGAIDFVETFGFLVRELYCGYTCPDRKDCDIAKEFLPKEIKLYDATNDPDVLEFLEEKNNV
ncbi:MAG: hypothetical protein M0R17_01775 [Candidatus Omnitrophica bacterium]|jgi:hypothetical protein|nr:hypothetical protein [Candidatus Omnitrophota bacterium]